MRGLRDAGRLNGIYSCQSGRQSITGSRWLPGALVWSPDGHGHRQRLERHERAVGIGDFNGDRTADVLAREASTGILRLYPGNGTGGWLARVRADSGWNGMDRLFRAPRGARSDQSHGEPLAAVAHTAG